MRDGSAALLAPAMIAIIVLLHLNFRSGRDAVSILFTLPFALVGGMVSATVLTLVIIPSLYLIVNGWKLPREG